MVAQKIPGGAVGVVFQRVGGVAADDAAQDGVGVLRSKWVFAGDLCRQTVGGGGIGAAVSLAQTRGVQQADGAHFLFQRHKGAFCGGVVGGRHKDIKAAVAKAGLHAVLPAFVLHVQQLTEDAGVRLHATAFQLGIHGIPHPGGGVPVGVHPLAAGYGIQLGAFLGLLPLQSGRLSLPVRLTPNDLCYLQAAACLRELEDANRAKRPGYELLVKGALLRFLALLIAQGRQCLPTETADTQRLKTVLQWLSAHYAEPLRVADAAGVCSFSASHSMRWFRQMTGQSFISFLNEYRLNTAAEVLQTTDETVLTIATRCGFENLSYFNRAFKAHFGMTPREYRKK